MSSKSPIIIAGFMGCGKTEVARSLAERLQRKPIDLDVVISDREGKSPARLIVEDGISVFRLCETRALKATLENEPLAVIALGGGAWIEDTNRRLIDQFQGTTVWLDVPFAVCWQRICQSEEDRPLGRTKDQAQLLFDERRPIYKLAQLHCEYSPAETVDQLAERIASRLTH